MNAFRRNRSIKDQVQSNMDINRKPEPQLSNEAGTFFVEEPTISPISTRAVYNPQKFALRTQNNSLARENDRLEQQATNLNAEIRKLHQRMSDMTAETVAKHEAKEFRLRERALSMALGTPLVSSSDSIVSVASTFYDYLAGNDKSLPDEDVGKTADSSTQPTLFDGFQPPVEQFLNKATHYLTEANQRPVESVGRKVFEEAAAINVGWSNMHEFFGQDPKTLEEAVYVALGAASMCWTETPQGVFDSERASMVGQNLLRAIEELSHREVPDSANTDRRNAEGEN